MSNDLIEIARFHSATDAAIVRNRLEDADIRACLDGEAMGSWFGHFGSAIGGVKILVKEEDAQRAAEILSADYAREENDESIDFGDGFPEEDEDHENEISPEISPELTRAFRASIMGIILLPPLLNIYSMYLIFRHRLFRSPRNWRVGMAICTNLFIFLFFGVLSLAGWFTTHEVLPTYYESDVVPLEGKPVIIPIVPYD